ncbi:MAG: Gx transporter family protein [Oscillospiraceae bacterium]
MNRERKKSPAYKAAFAGVMLALTIALSWVENVLISDVPFLPPGVRLGISNVVIMYCLIYVSPAGAAGLGAAKVLFVFATRGATAGIMSACGTAASLIFMYIFSRIFKERSPVMLGIIGALAHNAGQLLGMAALMSSWSVFVYAPVLVLSGIAAGILTGLCLKGMARALAKASLNP